MTPDELRFALAKAQISQADFARLLDLTPRAISLWLSGERGVPGTVSGYLRLFSMLSTGQQQAELARINVGVKTLKDGMYSIQFTGQAGSGVGVLTFSNGIVYGVDAGKGKYDGRYEANPATGKVDVSIRVQMPANEPSVIGMVHPFDWALDVKTSLDPSLDAGIIQVQTSLGRPLNARYEYLRSLPE